MALKGCRLLLASGARLADTASPAQADRRSMRVRLYLSVTAASGSGGLRPVIRGYDPASAKTFEMSTGGVAAATQTGLYVYEMRPGPLPEPFGCILERMNDWLPGRWDVLVKHGDGSSYTYSLGCEVDDD